ncbi:hypothetical protein ACET3Z_021010 [Daucus carota]
MVLIRNGDNTYVAYTIIMTTRYKEGTNRIWSDSVYITSHLSSSVGCFEDFIDVKISWDMDFSYPHAVHVLDLSHNLVYGLRNRMKRHKQ